MAYPFNPMTQSQIDEFLQTVRNVVVGTNRIDGAPQLSPTYFLYDQGRVYIGINAGSAKHHNLRRDPRISICVDGGHTDFRTITIYGTAEFIEQDNPRRDDIIWRINRRYAASDEEARRAIEAAKAHTETVLIAVTPEKTIARDYNDSE